MTIVLAAIGREAIWMLTDRRLSIKGHPPIDDGRKVMHLDTRDGRAILGYAGLGLTSLGTEPADWMSNVLRGRNVPLEAALSTLADACKREMPRHLAKIPGPGWAAHHIIIPAFVQREARVYSIDIALKPNTKTLAFRWTRHVRGDSTRPPRLVMSGSGIHYLMRARSWQRPILRMVAAHDKGRISAHAVADEFAKLNMQTHHGLADQTVGPNCIVSWKYCKPGKYDGGGGHEAYIGTARVGTPMLPTIATGMDLKMLIQSMGPEMQELMDAAKAGRAPRAPNKDDMNTRLAKLPHQPDEKFR